MTLEKSQRFEPSALPVLTVDPPLRDNSERFRAPRGLHRIAEDRVPNSKKTRA